MMVPRVHNVSSWQAQVRKTWIDSETVAASYDDHIVVDETDSLIPICSYFTVSAISFLQFTENYWGITGRIWGLYPGNTGKE